MPDSPLLNLVHTGGPTVVFDWAGLHIVSDPTFDPPGEYSEGRTPLTKVTGPSISVAELGAVDLVLLSHDQHPDNLDRLGREVLAAAPVALSTEEAAQRDPGIVGLAPWATYELTTAAGVRVTVTAVPARHGPPGCEPGTGTVTGFHLSAPGQPSVYLSGDNAALELVEQIVERMGAVDVAVLHLGAARVPVLDADLTFGAAAGVAAARILAPAAIALVHNEGWAHFTETPDDSRTAFTEAGLADRLVI